MRLRPDPSAAVSDPCPPAPDVLPALPRRRLLGAAALLPLAGLGGCQALGVARQPFVVLQPRPALPAISGGRVPWQLVVETPAASATLDSTHIAVMPAPGVLNVYPDARWPEPAPRMLRNLLVRGFEQSGRIVGVGVSSTGLRADLVLAIDLHDFQIENTGERARAALRLHARLIDVATSRVLDAQPFAAEAPAEGDTALQALRAFEQVLGELIPQVVAWSLRMGGGAAAPD